MGVKSTRELSGQQAAELYAKLKMKGKYEKYISKAFKKMSDDCGSFENLLERLNDEAHDGEGFENYTINH